MRQRQAKLDALLEILAQMNGVVVAFSGGVDSTFLLAAACRALNDRVIAATARSLLYHDFELREAKEITGDLGVRHIVFHSDELGTENFAQNPPDRCYWCKRDLFEQLQAIADEQGLENVIHAAQTDDLSDHRPGFRAAEELGVRAPLIEADLSKDEVRALSRQWGLPTAGKPAMACLASRFPYGQHITAEKLKQVAAVENVLRECGFEQFRVRHHGQVARIEVEPKDLSRLLTVSLRSQVVAACRDAGFTYATVDLEGYRSGSMNETLEREQTHPGPGT